MAELTGWPPEDSFVVGDVILRLRAGMEDRSRWSWDVRSALFACALSLKEFGHRDTDDPDGLEQVTAATDVFWLRTARFLRRNPHPTRSEILSAGKATQQAMDQAMRRTAIRQQQRREARRSQKAGRRRSPEPLRSVIDGWRWQRGRPRGNADVLLLKVEVWRDLRAKALPHEGRISRAAALAEVIVEDLKVRDRAALQRVLHWQAQHRYEGDNPVLALTKAVADVLGKSRIRSIEAQFSQALDWSWDPAGNAYLRRSSA